MTNTLLTFFGLFFLLIIFFKFFKVDQKITHGFIVCKTEFRSNVSFELVRETKLVSDVQRILGSVNEIKIGDKSFDSRVFISSDFKVIKKILENSEVKVLIEKIMYDSRIKGIFFKNQSVYLVNEATGYAEPNLKENVEKLSAMFSKLFSEERHLEKRENIKFAFKVEKILENMKAFYFSFFVSSIIVFVYLSGFHPDNIIYINEWYLLPPVLVLGSLLFIIVNLLTLSKITGTIRIHTVYLINVCMFLPACFMFSYIMLNTLNVILDKSEVKYSINSYSATYINGRKNSKRYYLITKLDASSPLTKDAFFEKNRTYEIRVSKNMYHAYSNSKNKKIEVYVKDGYFGYPYITNIVKKN